MKELNDLFEHRKACTLKSGDLLSRWNGLYKLVEVTRCEHDASLARMRMLSVDTGAPVTIVRDLSMLFNVMM